MHDISLILDIGNGSIGVVLVKYERTGSGRHSIPTILYCHREPLTFLPNIEEKRLLAAMLELLKTTLSYIQKEIVTLNIKRIFGQRYFDHVVCIFSSPWYISQASVITKESDNSFFITNTLIDELISKEEIRFAKALEQGEYEKHFGSKVVLLERALIHTAINGYEVTNPVGKSGRALEITLFTSLISEKVLRLVEELFYKTFHIRQIECFSYALASWNAIRTMFPTATDFIFLDVGGETSDVTITIRGAITETISFPFGRSSILRTLVEQMKISPETAVAFIKMRSAGTLEKSSSANVEKILRTISDQWVINFNQTLSTISKKYNLPKRAFVTVDSDFSSFFNEILNRPDIGPALFKGPFETTIVAGATIASIIHTARPQNEQQTNKKETISGLQFLPGATDSALAIETIFFSNKIT